MAKSCDVVVIGGGVIGLISAWMLAKQGVSVTLVERGEIGRESSWAGAGIIPPGHFQYAQTPLDKLRAWSSERYPSLVQELEEATGLGCEYHVCGGIEFVESPDTFVPMWEAEKITFQEIPSHPKLNFPSGTTGFSFPKMAQIRNPRYLKALHQACLNSGVEIRTQTTVEGFEKSHNKVNGVKLHSDEILTAKHFVIAAGAWSEGLLQHFGVVLNIHPVRGQIAMFATERNILNEIVIVDKRYLVPRQSGEILTGSTEEPDAGFIKENTADGITTLIEFARTLVPELQQCEVIRTWAGLRPGSPDGLPYIGRVGEFENVIFAVGHFRAGIQLSPATGQLVSNMILAQESVFDERAFALNRERVTGYQASFRS